MNRSLAKNISREILRYRSQTRLVTRPCDVFLNHRGIDTKRSVAGLLYDSFSRLNIRSFLDTENMKPGDKLFTHIDSAIQRCKVGVAVFSPRYCESHFCLHELALMMECKKKVIPIFCDIKPSELHVLDNGSCTAEELQKFRRALKEAKYTVGLAFDSRNGNWSDLVTSATDIVVQSLIEVDRERGERREKTPILY